MDTILRPLAYLHSVQHMAVANLRYEKCANQIKELVTVMYP